MLELRERFVTIAYLGNPTRLKVRRFKWGDLVLVDPITLPAKGKKSGEEIPSGVIFRRNAQMGKDTDHESEWMLYRNLYEIWRAGWHMKTRYHKQERIELDGFREKAFAFVQYLVYLKSVREEDKKRVVDAFVLAAEELSGKRATRKVVAGARFLEATPGVRGNGYMDSSGRRNPVAAAMIVGAGQGHIIERWEDAEAIVSRTDLRTVELFNAIRYNTSAYWDLWFALSPQDRPYRDVEILRSLHLSITGRTEGPMRISLEDRTEGNLKNIAYQLRQYRDAFLAIAERPYRNNAKHTANDLETAMAYALDNQPDDVVLALDKVRNGIRWMFALHVLQMSFITPLAFLLERLTLQSNARRKSGDDEVDVRISRTMAKDDFAAMESAMDDFKARVVRCKDQFLDRRIKERALARVAMVQGLMDCDKWPEAKDAAIKLSLLF